MFFVGLEKAFVHFPHVILYGCSASIGRGFFAKGFWIFKCLGVFLTNEGRLEHEIDKQIGAASAVMRFVYQTIMVTLAFGDISALYLLVRLRSHSQLWS